MFFIAFSSSKDSFSKKEKQWKEDKILMINVVNYKILKRLRENNETDKLSSTKEKFHQELKSVLTESQFEKFLVEFPNL